MPDVMRRQPFPDQVAIRVVGEITEKIGNCPRITALFSKKSPSWCDRDICNTLLLILESICWCNGPDLRLQLRFVLYFY